MGDPVLFNLLNSSVRVVDRLLKLDNLRASVILEARGTDPEDNFGHQQLGFTHVRELSKRLESNSAGRLPSLAR